MSRLRTNNKAVQEAMIKHVREHYPDDKALSRDIQAGGGGVSYFLQTGCIETYTSDMREALRVALNETEEEANTYTCKQVQELYYLLTSRAIYKILEGLQ